VVGKPQVPVAKATALGLLAFRALAAAAAARMQVALAALVVLAVATEQAAAVAAQAPRQAGWAGRVAPASSSFSRIERIGQPDHHGE